MSPIDKELHPVIHAGRVAVITGAASGIGRAAAVELAKCVDNSIMFISLRADQLLYVHEQERIARRACRRE